MKESAQAELAVADERDMIHINHNQEASMAPETSKTTFASIFDGIEVGNSYRLSPKALVEVTSVTPHYVTFSRLDPQTLGKIGQPITWGRITLADHIHRYIKGEAA